MGVEWKRIPAESTEKKGGVWNTEVLSQAPDQVGTVVDLLNREVLKSLIVRGRDPMCVARTERGAFWVVPPQRPQPRDWMGVDYDQKTVQFSRGDESGDPKLSIGNAPLVQVSQEEDGRIRETLASVKRFLKSAPVPN